jgi:hypothetical protein
MTKEQTMQLQRDLAARGLYAGAIDGDWGPASRVAWAAALALLAKVSAPTVPPTRSLAWGARVSQTFRDRVCWMADNLAMPADGASWLMACMAWESAETFAPDVRNMAGSGATGLIQFMPSTALAMDTTVGDLAQMTAENQLNFVFRYFKPLKGRLQSLGDVYMAILWPAGIGKPENFVLWDRVSRPTTYRQNVGLDINKDGAITRAEAVAKVQATLERGLNAGNAWEIQA